jgi:restriction system protein
MPHWKRHPVSEVLIGAAATLVRPFASVAEAAASAVSFLRRSRKPVTGSRQSAAWPALDTGRWNPELLKQLEWRRFEELCVAYFETLGSRTRIAQSGAEGGIDIHLYAEGSDSVSMIVQCKAWNVYGVGIKSVRKLSAVMASASVGKGALVTSGRFTQEAIAFAGQENIELIDGARLLGEFAALPPEKALALLKFATQGDFLTPTCPSCSIKMISRQSTKQGRKFWGCRNYPRCKQTFPDSPNAPA